MGANESRHSTKSDVLPNLQWALNELMLWRQRAAEDKLAEEQATRMYSRSGIVAPGSGIGDIPSRDLREVGMPASAFSSTSAQPIGGNVPTTTAGAAATTTPTPTTIGSGIESGAGTTNISTTSTEMSSNMMSSSSTTVQPSPSVSTESKRLVTGSIGSMMEQPNLEAQLAVDRADGLIIREKYLFILDHIEQLVQAAEQNYMMICKNDWIKGLQSKVNTSLVTGPTTKAELERKMNENNAILMKDLADWDNARAAVHWLQRHFDLLVHRRMLAREITHINNRIRVLQTEVPTQDTLDEIRNLRVRLNTAHEGVVAVKKEAKQLQRESLAVGLQYLDVNQSGSIEPADQPQLRSELFSRLDIRHKHKIAESDLQSAVDKMEKNVQQCQQRVYEAEADLAKLVEERDRQLHLLAADPSDSERKRAKIEQMNVDIQRRQEHVLQLKRDKDREKTFLRDTYSMFQRAFVESLFDKLGRSRAQDKAMYDAYREEMAAIDRNINNLHIAADQGSKGLATTNAMLGSRPIMLDRRRMPLPTSPLGAGTQAMGGMVAVAPMNQGALQQQPMEAQASAAVPQAPPPETTLAPSTTTTAPVAAAPIGSTGMVGDKPQQGGNLTTNIQKAALQRQPHPPPVAFQQQQT